MIVGVTVKTTLSIPDVSPENGTLTYSLTPYGSVEDVPHRNLCFSRKEPKQVPFEQLSSTLFFEQNNKNRLDKRVGRGVSIRHLPVVWYVYPL